MEKMTVQETDDAVSGVLALRKALDSELSTIERLIQRVDRNPGPSAAMETAEVLETYRRVRTILLSALASADEVLGWVRVLAVRDPEGNELDCVRSLPMVSVLPAS